MSTGIAHKEVLKSKRGRRMTEAEWEFATDDYKELRKVRKMKATQFKEYRDDITEGKFPRNLIAKALKIAKKSGGQMTKAWKQIEKIKKGLGDDPIIADALRVANEEAVAEWNTGTRRCKGGDGRRKLVKAQRALELATEEDDEVEEGYSSSQVKKAIKIAHDMGGNMTGAVKKIERIKRGLSDDEAVEDALKSANEAFIPKGMKIPEGSKEEYQKFFNSKLAKYKVKSPAELDDAQKKKFFNEIEKEWKSEDE